MRQPAPDQGWGSEAASELGEAAYCICRPHVLHASHSATARKTTSCGFKPTTSDHLRLLLQLCQLFCERDCLALRLGALRLQQAAGEEVRGRRDRCSWMGKPGKSSCSCASSDWHDRCAWLPNES